MMIPHGPAASVFEKASKAELKPERVAENTMVSTVNFVLQLYEIFLLTSSIAW